MPPEYDPHRRKALVTIASLGGGAVFARALWAQAEGTGRVTEKMLTQAEWVAGIELTEAERELMLQGVSDLLDSYDALRAVELDNGVPPALHFRTADHETSTVATATAAAPHEWSAAPLPGDEADVAFAPVSEQAAWIRSRALSSVELTQLYLSRLERHDPRLACTIGLTAELALEQAQRADHELARGRYRGPLHGIPWGAKDLLAVPGYRTTWGARPFADQTRPELATVAARLSDAGAVLVAKLTLGALAWGDVWYGGTTKNPWNLDEGSSGSSAGSASATAAGLVGFAIGSETWGSIVSPCTRCGATGLRPTFGRVSRYGAMALAWSMDKLGPIARSVEDCALVFGAIHGSDGLDPTAIDRPFRWPPRRDPRTLKVGFVPALFDDDRGEGIDDEARRAGAREWQKYDRRTLATLRELGMELVPVELPSRYPVGELSFILTAEAATAFDELTRSGRDDELVRQVRMAWPNVFRQGQTIPAVEYLRANRIRTLVQREMEEALGDVDLYLTPSFGGDNLLLTNLTGHPCVVLPNGFRTGDGTPTSITFNGRLHRESEMLAAARAYQRATGFHLQRPPLFAGGERGDR